MKKDFLTGNAIFLGVLLLLALSVVLHTLVPEWREYIPSPAILVSVMLLWTIVWRLIAWFAWRHQIAAIFELTGQTKNTGQDIPDIIEQLNRNAGDGLLRAVINERIKQMIGDHAWTARKMVGELNELRMSQRDKFGLDVELDTYTKLAEKLWDEEIEHKIQTTKHPPDVFHALVGRIAVRELTGQMPTALPSYGKVVKYFEGLDAQTQRKILIEGNTWVNELTGERGLKEHWEGVMTDLRSKFWPKETPVTT